MSRSQSTKRMRKKILGQSASNLYDLKLDEYSLGKGHLTKINEAEAQRIIKNI